MDYPISTGQAARLLRVTEPRLAELVRRGRINPQSMVLAGRRLWQLEHVLQAARLLGVPGEALSDFDERAER